MENSKWFKEGYAAAKTAEAGTVCPYGKNSAKALIWEAGYAQAVQDTNDYAEGLTTPPQGV